MCKLSDIHGHFVQVDKIDPVKMQKEKERLERQQLEGDVLDFARIFVNRAINFCLAGMRSDLIFAFLAIDGGLYKHKISS